MLWRQKAQFRATTETVDFRKRSPVLSTIQGTGDTPLTELPYS